MGQSLQRLAALLFLTAAGGVLAPACVKNESSLFVRACLASPQDTCLVTPDPSATELFSGVVDPALADYSCALLLGNQLVARGDSKQLRTETSRIEVQSAVVTVYDTPTRDNTLIAYTVPASGFVDPGTSTQPGFGAAFVLLLDRVTARKHVGEQLVSGVVVKGRTLGGLDVESAEFLFPIEVLPPTSTCNTAACFPGAMPDDMPKTNCHPGTGGATDCREGCQCLANVGDCAPLGCQLASKGDTSGFCGACLTSADCTAPAKCVKTAGNTGGLCQ